MSTAERSVHPSFVVSDTATEPPHIQGKFTRGSIMDDDLIYTDKSFMIVAFDTATATILPHFDRRATAATINRRIIKSFADLQPGWNGGSGEPVPDEVIQRALALIDRLEFQDMEIFPTGRKTIQFEFDIGTMSLEVEIGADGATILRSNEATGEEREFELKTDREIVDEIRRFHG